MGLRKSQFVEITFSGKPTFFLLWFLKDPGCEFGSVDFHDKLSLMNSFQDTDIRKNIYSMSKKSIDILISESFCSDSFFYKIGLFAYLTLLLFLMKW